MGIHKQMPRTKIIEYLTILRTSVGASLHNYMSKTDYIVIIDCIKIKYQKVLL